MGKLWAVLIAIAVIAGVAGVIAYVAQQNQAERQNGRAAGLAGVTVLACPWSDRDSRRTPWVQGWMEGFLERERREKEGEQ